MSEATTAAKPAALESVFARLARLRWQIAAWLWIDGLGRVLWLAIALAAADFLLDWTFRLDRAQRVFLFVFALGLLTFATYRWLARPLSHKLDDEALALEVERTHPRLKQSLITAVQFARRPSQAARGISSSLISRAIAQGATLAAGVRFDDVIHFRRQRHNLLRLLAVAILILTAMTASTVAAPLRVWFARNVLLREATWPQKTYLVIENARADGAVLFPRGGEWTLKVTVREDSQIIPENVEIEISGPSGVTSRELEQVGDGRFATTFIDVVEPFRFRARGGDDTTPWYRIELADRPELSTLRLFVTPPTYAGDQQEELAAGQGPYAVLPGSKLKFAATANKRLSRATLFAEGERLISPESTQTQSETPLREAIELHTDETGHISGELRSDQILSGNYRLELADRFGFREREPIRFTLRKRADQAPRVRLQLPATRAMVTPQASLPFECDVSDDFGLSKLTAHIRWQSPEGTPAGEAALNLNRSVDDGLVKPGVFTIMRDLRLSDVLDLQPHAIPPGSSLQFWIDAQDNDDISGPNTGRSAEIVLRVVTPEELRVDLLHREKELRQQFERLVQDQEALVIESRALAATLAGNSGSLPDPRQTLAQIERRQRDLTRDLSTIGQRFAGIVSEVQSNRLEEDGGKLQSRLQNEIVEPIQRVAQTTLDSARTELDRARWADSADQRQSALAEASRHQAEAATAFAAILRHLVESETFQEAVNLLYELQIAQAEVNEHTNKARQEKIKRLLEGNRQPSSQERSESR